MAVSTDRAVVELLDSRNYVDWSVLVKTYLLAQDLWDVVEEDEEEEADDKFKVSKKKNATALHKIQISCGREAFSLIRNTTSAKRAWDTLAEKFKPKPAVVELLDSSNYVDWSVWVKTNLLAQDLWDVVEEDEEEEEEEADDKFKAWREKNATALHKIQISCGREASSLIRNTSSAKRAWDTLAENVTNETPKRAWDTLAEKFKPKPDAAIADPYQPFFTAVKLGDWRKAKEFLTRDPNAIRATYSTGGTALHIATKFGHEHIVEELVQLMTPEDLEIVEDGNWTALHLAARLNLKMVECIVTKNKKLLGFVEESEGLTPILLAAKNDLWDIVRYLYSLTPIQDLMPDNGPYGAGLVCNCFHAKQFGIHIQHPLAIPDFHVNVENLEEKLGNQNISFSVFGFTQGPSSSLRKLLGMLSPTEKLDRISGAALQMQRERQWFKEVESVVVTPSGVGVFNKQGMTPHELFTQNHNKLKEEGEKWMKDTATSCTVVGALTITIMFAAAFTVPGGNNGGTGFPLFLDENMFMVFIVSDAISLFSSTTSVLMFLGILTSRYAEDDFLKSLPTKMIIGLSTLLISIASMMVAFCSALFLMLHERLWIVIPIIFLAGVPVTLFIWMQFPLLVEIFISTYGGGIFDKKVRHWI
ncbi:ankyrin repeat-containing protein ITN1-like [Prunus avium]|uniref:Ankyrin repeat-containing protein ITN1-like n=1 Tax=Prunus avium TaxID=42229 RepID=A0A6P5TVI2_PRUAV|nr:ankyrin repeat-containing protein ITN1-like [Prunus avium]